MPNKNYVNGYNFERLTKKKWEEKGFYVIRSSGSHGVADLVALSIEEFETDRATVLVPKVVLIQCKTKGVISLEDRHLLKKTADSLCAKAVLAYRDKKNKYTEEWL